MIQRSFSTEGIILSRKNYGEADRLLTIFSKHHGKMFLLAKGVRKPSSRKRGHIEIFSQVKYSFTKNDHYTLMNEAELIESYDEIRVSLKKTSLAYYFIEAAAKLIQEDEKHGGLYEMLIEYLELIKKRGDLRNIRFAFIKDFLTELGFWPKGKEMDDPDKVLEAVLERNMNSKRVGERMLK